MLGEWFPGTHWMAEILPNMRGVSLPEAINRFQVPKATIDPAGILIMK